MTATDNTPDVIQKENVELKLPNNWVIVFHNDDVTPMDFVVEVLYYIFKKDIQTATEIMLKVHTEGKAVAGIFSYEMAEQKLGEANALIAISGMALKLTIEEE